MIVECIYAESLSHLALCSCVVVPLYRSSIVCWTVEPFVCSAHALNGWMATKAETRFRHDVLLRGFSLVRYISSFGNQRRHMWCLIRMSCCIRRTDGNDEEKQQMPSVEWSRLLVSNLRERGNDRQQPICIWFSNLVARRKCQNYFRLSVDQMRPQNGAKLFQNKFRFESYRLRMFSIYANAKPLMRSIELFLDKRETTT